MEITVKHEGATFVICVTHRADRLIDVDVLLEGHKCGDGRCWETEDDELYPCSSIDEAAMLTLDYAKEAILENDAGFDMADWHGAQFFAWGPEASEEVVIARVKLTSLNLT